MMKQKKYISATFWNIFDRIIILLKSIFVSIILARSLGVEDYGNYCYIISLITILQCFPRYGLENIVIKDFSNHDNEFSYLISSQLVSVTGSFIGVFAILCLGIINQFSKKIIILSIIFFCFHCFEIFRYLLYAYFETKKYNICKDIIILFELCIHIWGAFLHKDVEYFVCIYLLGELVILFTGDICSQKIIETWEKKVNFNEIKKNLRHLLMVCTPLTFSALSVSIYMKIDQIMIKNYLNASQLGIYSVAVKIAESWYFLPTALCLSLLPKFAQLYSENCNKMWDKYKEYMIMLVAMSLFVGGLISVFAEPVICVLYGSDYAKAVPVLCMYVWGGVFVSLGCARGIYTAIKEYTMINFVQSIVGAVLNVLLNFMLIPIYGIYGAVFATLISYALQGWLLNFTFKNTRKVAILQTRSLFRFYLAPVYIYSYFILNYSGRKTSKS